MRVVFVEFMTALCVSGAFAAPASVALSIGYGRAFCVAVCFVFGLNVVRGTFK